jgi:hypothetical protein
VNAFIRSSLSPALLLAVAGSVHAAPVRTPWPTTGPAAPTAVAASPMGGRFVTTDTAADTVEIRDAAGVLRRTIDRARIAPLVPWMALDASADGPASVATSASGRLLFILVHDDTTDASNPSDAILRYDTSSDVLSRFARVELSTQTSTPPLLALVHHRAVLYVGNAAGQLLALPAPSGPTTGAVAGMFTLPTPGPIRGLTVDRDSNTLFAANDTAVYRAPFPSAANVAPVWSTLATPAGSDLRGLAWGDHFGGPGQRGLYILAGNTPTGSRVLFLPSSTVLSQTNLTPSLYTTALESLTDLAFTPTGALLAAADTGALLLTDDTDSRLAFPAFLADEFNQHVAFAKGLISPDGEPAGWVIDADTEPATPRFHPATPDGAAWTILVLLAADRINADPQALPLVRTILERYAGLAPDNIRPVRSSEGIYKHWLNPLTGNTKPTWPDEYATLSTMKIVLAASRAITAYPDDERVARAASRIIFGVSNWQRYLQTGTDALAFKGLASGGPDTSSWSRPFHEGILFAEQAGFYSADPAGIASANRWFTRSLWPTATFLPSRPITVGATNIFQPAFITAYPLQLSPRFRADTSLAGWNAHTQNLFWSNAAWTDDQGPRFAAVFSAGTSPSGYNADTLTNRPGDITTFPSLLAFTSTGDVDPAVAAYAAYRKGARQTFRTGASLLYRRPLFASSSFVPNSAGLPDVSIGGLGIAELLDPGITAELLAAPYTPRELCPVDRTGDGVVDHDDLYAQLSSPIDLNADGVVNSRDAACLKNWLRQSEPRSATGR